MSPSNFVDPTVTKACMGGRESEWQTHVAQIDTPNVRLRNDVVVRPRVVVCLKQCALVEAALIESASR